MIPPDLASTLRATLAEQQTSALQQQKTQPVLPAQRINDALSNLVPGQRIFAEVQGMLANGTYRAVVAQREITLALPFAAKAGDSLELEVAESDGKLTLAFIANRGDGTAKPGQQSVATSLSQAGKLIGDLMQEIGSDGKRAPAAPLNSSQPLTPAMPRDAAQLVPVLKQALSQSGMFYESHQAKWVSGQFTTEQLRQEPQGKLPLPPSLQMFSSEQRTTNPALANAPATSNTMPPLPGTNTPLATATSSQVPTPSPGTPANTAANTATQSASTALPTSATNEVSPSSNQNQTANLSSATTSATREGTQQLPSPSGNPIPREITPLVQQQLDGLANQNFAWQGQVWPGQKMWWEIGENPEDSRRVGEEASARWRTRLKLELPELGGIDARLFLQAGGDLAVRILATSQQGETRLREAMPVLQQQLEAAGLRINQILIDHDPSPET